MISCSVIRGGNQGLEKPRSLLVRGWEVAALRNQCISSLSACFSLGFWVPRTIITAEVESWNWTLPSSALDEATKAENKSCQVSPDLKVRAHCLGPPTQETALGRVAGGLCCGALTPRPVGVEWSASPWLWVEGQHGDHVPHLMCPLGPRVDECCARVSPRDVRRWKVAAGDVPVWV